MRLCLLLGIATATGCGAGAASAVKTKAASDMACASDKLAVRTEQSIHYVDGCGEIGRYFVACNVFGYCPSPTGEVVSRLVRKQAAFDFDCKQSDLTLSHLNADTFGVKGCDKQASYVLVDCNRGACRVVQNTQTQ